jgi:hypothetical protein
VDACSGGEEVLLVQAIALASAIKLELEVELELELEQELELGIELKLELALSLAWVNGRRGMVGLCEVSSAITMVAREGRRRCTVGCKSLL